MENQANKGTEYISICCILVFMLISSLIIYLTLHGHRREGAEKQTLKAAREEKSITAEYLLSYILPLFAFDFTLWNQVVLFLIFFLTLGFLCIRHNYHSANLLLEIAGYRFYQCGLVNDDNVKTKQLIMSKRRLNGLIEKDIYVMALNNDYSLEINEKS